MHEVLNEIVEKVPTLTVEERRELIELLNQTEFDEKSNNKKGFVGLDTIWIKENSDKYAGSYVALKNGQLLAVGSSIKEANLKALEKGVKNPLLHYIPRKNEKLSGGW